MNLSILVVYPQCCEYLWEDSTQYFRAKTGRVQSPYLLYVCFWSHRALHGSDEGCGWHYLFCCGIRLLLWSLYVFLWYLYSLIPDGSLAISLSVPMLGNYRCDHSLTFPSFNMVLNLGALSKDFNEIGARIGIDFFFCGTSSFVEKTIQRL